MSGGGAVDLRDWQFRANIEWLHKLGPRALLEFLVELGATRMCRTKIEIMLRYARLDPAILAAIHARWLP